MFKKVPKNYKLNEGEEIICNVYDENDNLCDRIVMKAFSPEEKVFDEKTCEFCEKSFSSKACLTRHLKNNCSVVKYNLKNSEFSKEIVLEPNKKIKSRSPCLKLRDIGDVSGPQGAGKSTYCMNYMKEYNALFPDNKIYIFSKIEEDKSFDNLKELFDNGIIRRIDLSDEELKNDPIEVDELKNSLCVFDDYLKFDDDIRKSIEHTILDVLQNGRAHTHTNDDVYCLVTTHRLLNGKKTENLLTELSFATIFPNAGTNYQIGRYLKEYCGFGGSIISKILKLPSRWVTVTSTYPMYILYEKGCFVPF